MPPRQPLAGYHAALAPCDIAPANHAEIALKRRWSAFEHVMDLAQHLHFARARIRRINELLALDYAGNIGGRQQPLRPA